MIVSHLDMHMACPHSIIFKLLIEGVAFFELYFFCFFKGHNEFSFSSCLGRDERLLRGCLWSSFRCCGFTARRRDKPSVQRGRVKK